MTLSTEYRNYAAQCERMLKYTGDADTRAIWKRMAARWQQAAELEEQRAAQPQGYNPLRHGESALRWS
jgi:hypothetical protein